MNTCKPFLSTKGHEGHEGPRRATKGHEVCTENTLNPFYRRATKGHEHLNTFVSAEDAEGR